MHEYIQQPFSTKLPFLANLIGDKLKEMETTQTEDKTDNEIVCLKNRFASLFSSYTCSHIPTWPYMQIHTDPIVYDHLLVGKTAQNYEEYVRFAISSKVNVSDPTFQKLAGFDTELFSDVIRMRILLILAVAEFFEPGKKIRYHIDKQRKQKEEEEVFGEEETKNEGKESKNKLGMKRTLPVSETDQSNKKMRFEDDSIETFDLSLSQGKRRFWNKFLILFSWFLPYFPFTHTSVVDILKQSKQHWIHIFRDVVKAVDPEFKRVQKTLNTLWSIEIQKFSHSPDGIETYDNINFIFRPRGTAKNSIPHEYKEETMNADYLNEKLKNPDSVYTLYEMGLLMAKEFYYIICKNLNEQSKKSFTSKYNDVVFNIDPLKGKKRKIIYLHQA